MRRLMAFFQTSRRRQSAPAALVALHPGVPVWTPRNFVSLANEGFMRNVVAYRCVRMIAEAAASVPWVLLEGEQELSDHPALSILNRPNPFQSGGEFMEEWYSYLQISGNAYMEAVTLEGVVRELCLLRPDRIKIIPDSKGWPKAYEYAVEGNTVRYPLCAGTVSPVLHMRVFHPLNDHYGMSPLEAAAASVDIHNSASRWSKSLLDNAARPSGALVYTGAAHMSADQFDRLRQELEEHYQGPSNAGRPLLLEGGLDWKSMAMTPKDVEFVEVRHVAAREIALAFGVPPMLLGIPGDNTYANFAEANRVFWRQTVLPLVARTAKALSAWLCARYGRSLRLWFDVNQVHALSGERVALWKRVAAADFLTVNEKRAAVGYGPVEGGDG